MTCACTTDIFTNPLEFLHFVQMRRDALTVGHVCNWMTSWTTWVIYLRHNHYPKHAAGTSLMEAKAHLQFVGYRQEIDKFFTARLSEPTLPSPLRQKMPAGMADLLDLLPHQREERALRDRGLLA
jgi:hypothetical protein